MHKMNRSSFIDDLEAGDHTPESKTKSSLLLGLLRKFLLKQRNNTAPSLVVSSKDNQPEVSFPRRDTPEEQQRDTWIRTEGMRILV